jgi:hypothetical protein
VLYNAGTHHHVTKSVRKFDGDDDDDLMMIRLFDGVGVLEQQSLSVLTEEMSAQNVSVLLCQCCCTEKRNAFHPYIELHITCRTGFSHLY